MIQLIHDIRRYFREERSEFQKVNTEQTKEAEKAYQEGVKSALKVVKQARTTRNNTEFLREVLKNHD